MDLTILDATVDDAGELLTLQRAAYLSEGELYQMWDIPPLRETLAEVRAAIRDSTVLKAVAGTRIVGSVRGRAVRDTCHIGRLAVAPDLQGNGVGTALVRAIEQRFPGATRYELFTGNKSEANLRLYRRLGYRDEPGHPDGHPLLTYLVKRAG